MRKASSDKSGLLKKGTWTPEEDRKLVAYVTRYGCWNWRQLPRFAGLARCGKSCRLRWLNYLRPGLKRGNYTPEEDEIIIRLHRQIGNRWSVIAAKLPGRTDNEIKNHWHTNLKNKHLYQLHLSKSDVDTHDRDDINIIFKLSNINDHCEGINITDAGMSSQTTDVGKSGPETETSLTSESSSDITRQSNEELVTEEHEALGFVDAYDEVMGGSFWTEPFVADDSLISHVTHDEHRCFTPSPISDNIAEFSTLNNFYDHYSGFF